MTRAVTAPRAITTLVALAMTGATMSGVPATDAGAVVAETAAAPAPPRVATAATFPGRNGRIAYTKEWHVPGDEYYRDVFTVRPDGTGEKRLTFSRDSSKPIWSPSGGRIAFERADAVWVMRADGTQKRSLVPGRLVGWMPTGGRVLVVQGLHDRPGVDPTWLLHHLATGEVEQLPIDLPLATGLEPPYPDRSEWSYVVKPTLAPDGELLAFHLTRWDYASDGYDYWFASLFTVRLDGTDLTDVGSTYSAGYGSLGWAPDGEEIVMVSSSPRFRCLDSVRSVHLDGTAGAVDISEPCFEDDPAWSPDGRRIAFTNSRSGRLQVASLDGSRIRTVLPGAVGVFRHEPDWRSVR